MEAVMLCNGKHRLHCARTEFAQDRWLECKFKPVALTEVHKYNHPVVAYFKANYYIIIFVFKILQQIACNILFYIIFYSKRNKRQHNIGFEIQFQRKFCHNWGFVHDVILFERMGVCFLLLQLFLVFCTFCIIN